MKKGLYVLGFSIFLLTAVFCGCQESDIEATSFEGITLVSSIVELSNASLEYIYTQEQKVEMVEVKYLLHNIAGRDLKNVQIYCDFYDSEDNLINRQGPKTITSMPIDYIEQISSGFNEFSYDGSDVELVDYVIISATEQK